MDAFLDIVVVDALDVFEVGFLEFGALVTIAASAGAKGGGRSKIFLATIDSLRIGEFAE